MELTKARLRSTELKDRRLWFDGDSSFDPAKLLRYMNQYDVRYVDEMTPDVKNYNKFAPPDKKIEVKTQCRPLSKQWTFPDEYKYLDVVEYLFDKHIKLTANLSADEIEKRDYRLLEEIAAYKSRGLFDVLRAIIWIINTLTANKSVWGVGRGSSVSSYVLYVIGVHDVDSFAYGLDINDFLHE